MVSWASKDNRRLDKTLIVRIIRAIEVFAETGHGDVKRLTNTNGECGFAGFKRIFKLCSFRLCCLGSRRTTRWERESLQSTTRRIGI